MQADDVAKVLYTASTSLAHLSQALKCVRSGTGCLRPKTWWKLGVCMLTPIEAVFTAVYSGWGTSGAWCVGLWSAQRASVLDEMSACSVAAHQSRGTLLLCQWRLW